MPCLCSRSISSAECSCVAGDAAAVCVVAACCEWSIATGAASVDGPEPSSTQPAPPTIAPAETAPAPISAFSMNDRRDSLRCSSSSLRLAHHRLRSAGAALSQSRPLKLSEQPPLGAVPNGPHFGTFVTNPYEQLEGLSSAA